MKRTKITAVVLSLAFLLSVVSANKSHKVYADEVEAETQETEVETRETETEVQETETTAETSEIEEDVVTDDAEDANAYLNGIEISEAHFSDDVFRDYVSDRFDTDHDNVLSVDEIDAVVSIDIVDRRISELWGIEYFKNLRLIRIDHCDLTVLDLSKNPNVETVVCVDNDIEFIDVSRCPNLEYLNCRKNKLISLDLSNNPNLWYVDCSENRIRNLDVSNHQNLTTLYCSYNDIGTLTADNCTSLKFFVCSHNCITDLDLSSCNTEGRDFSLTCDDEVEVIMHRDPVVDTELPEEEPVVEQPETVATVDMYRLYNPNSGEHFFTASAGERDMLVAAGWSNEGIGWKAPVTSNTPVYRLYNPQGGEHHYTISASEKNNLVALGWSDEGIGWYSDDAHGVPVYRQYNPNSFSNNHNYTVSASENNWLMSIGWQDEGVAWYGVV